MLHNTHVSPLLGLWVHEGTMCVGTAQGVGHQHAPCHKHTGGIMLVSAVRLLQLTNVKVFVALQLLL